MDEGTIVKGKIDVLVSTGAILDIWSLKLKGLQFFSSLGYHKHWLT